MKRLMFGLCLVLPLASTVACSGDDDDASSSDSGGKSGHAAGGNADAGAAAGTKAGGSGGTSPGGSSSSAEAGEPALPNAGSGGVEAGSGGEGGSGAPEPSVANAVYVMTNALAANEILGFERADDGSLTPMQDGYPTAGVGTGKGLGEQGALAYDRANNRILTVNAGDNSFSVLPVNLDGSLGAPLKVAASDFPTSAANMLGPKSITFSGNLVYVLYEGDATHPSMIAGWKLGGQPLAATPITKSAQPLSSAAISADPAQIELSPNGKVLIVTEKQGGNGTTVVAGPGSIDAFTVDANGLAVKKGFYPTAKLGDDFQMVPFGFEFFEDFLIVSEAGSQGAGSYSYTGGVVKPVAKGQFLPTDPAPCWVTFSGNHAYVTNAKGPNISGFDVSPAGALSSITPIANSIVATTGEVIPAATPGGMPTFHGPTDEFVSLDGKYLYVLNSAVPSIGIFEVLQGGQLARVGATDYSPAADGALPAGSVGIVAR
jgi:6-phosphogluconolactonase